MHEATCCLHAVEQQPQTEAMVKKQKEVKIYGYVNHNGLHDDDDDDDDDIDDRPPMPPPSHGFADLSRFTSARFIRPPKRLAGDRTISTEVRLRRQGFKASARSIQSGFAVRSIRRGSDDWHGLIKPFVADIAFRSLIRRRFQSEEVSFRPYTCHAGLLFVDLSSYSRITAAIAHRGAHFISSVVNAYLSRLLRIIHENGGDVVKFAGDAVLVVWEGEENDLGINLLCAAKCAMEIQEKAGSHLVDGTSLSFRTHCGITGGILESEIFAAPTHSNMQRLYHSVGGEAMGVIGELVDLAKQGEVCIDSDCIDFIGSRGKFKDIADWSGAMILESLDLDDSLLDLMDRHIEESLADRMSIRDKLIEEDFIHPSVLRLLTHGGLSPTHIAQMRNLCVLFIAMTSQGSSLNWLMEVQGVLDKNRCPIVQIIDDDKGVHIVAAVNLYEAIPEASTLGLNICRELKHREVGCAIGMASGTTFCGVTGCSSVACRWDITGPPAVRAARLMQHALLSDLEIVIDDSVYQDPMAATRMELLHPGITLKGAPEPCPIYTISNSKVVAAFRVLETIQGRCHDDIVADITDWISGQRRRVAAIVKGPPLAGKKIVCQRAAGQADMVPYLHISDASAGLVQLARTIATWFSYASEDVAFCAKEVLEHMEKMRWSRAHDACIKLVNTAIEEGITACFLIDRIQFLDEFSLSVIRECLHGRPKILRGSSRLSSGTSAQLRRSSATDTDFSESSEADGSNGVGKICFLCVHVSLYNWRSAEDIVDDITRSHKRLQVPIFEVREAREDELRTMFRDVADMEVEERWFRAYAEPSGYSAGYFIERAAALRNLSGKLWKEGKPGFGETTEGLVLHVPAGYMRKNKDVKVMQISADVAMRFAQIYDELPPVMQIFSKILVISTRKGYYKLPRSVMWEVLNDLISDGVDADVLTITLEEMTEMYLIKVEQEGDEDVISFQNPALGDIAMDVCTPVQVHTICTALIERLEPRILWKKDFKEKLVVADLYNQLGEKEAIQKHLWSQGYKGLLETSKDWPKGEVNMWKETIEDDIEGAGYDALDVLGDDFAYPSVSKKSVCTCLPLLKIYSGPIAFGPMGHSLSLICRNIFHEYGVFHGASQKDINTLLDSTKSGAQRYLKEMAVLDSFLADHGIQGTEDHLEKERGMISYLSTPAKSDEEVVTKAQRILGVYIPQFVEPRLKRLHSLIAKLRADGKLLEEILPSANIQIAFLRAYKCLQSSSKCRNDAAQDALMIMATLNWKPRPLPEYLPILHYQTVARIRNKALKKLNENQKIVLVHQQSIDDLEAFLVVTPLLYAAQDSGKC